MPTADVQLNSALNGPGHCQVGPGRTGLPSGTSGVRYGGAERHPYHDPGRIKGAASTKRPMRGPLTTRLCLLRATTAMVYALLPLKEYSLPPITIQRVCKRVQDSTWEKSWDIGPVSVTLVSPMARKLFSVDVSR